MRIFSGGPVHDAFGTTSMPRRPDMLAAMEETQHDRGEVDGC